MNPVCVFCRQPATTPASVEHIIPVSLGGNDGLVLEHGEVCQRCNGRLSVADEKLIDVLRPLLPFAAVRTRKGKFQAADLGNMQVTSDGLRAHVELDASGTGPVASTIAFLPDGEVQVTASVERRFDARLSRGLHKIAFELVCKEHGREAVLNEHFDELRAYILGTRPGFRHVLLFEPPPIDLRSIGQSHCLVLLMPFERDPLGYLAVLSFGGLRFEVAVAREDRHILEYGRELNRAAGRAAWLSFDGAGNRIDP